MSSGADALLVVAGRDKADTIELPGAARCPALTFAARDKVGGDGFAGPPLVVGNTLYAQTRKGKLVAYRAGGALN